MTLMLDHQPTAARFRALGPRHITQIAQRYGLPAPVRDDAALVSRVLPFRVNEYVLSELIDWSQAPDDPIFRLVFPQRGMLRAEDEQDLKTAIDHGAGSAEIAAIVRRIRAGLNPHPSGQRELNVPTVGSQKLPGVQHKYRETVLYFPAQGQSCHAFCTYCFRWAQFVGDPDLRFAAGDPAGLIAYLRDHPDVSDVLITGGDPLVMSTDRLRGHIEPLLTVDTVRTVRIGTKSLAYWPHRFVTDGDADDLLALFEQVVGSGRQLAVMAHFGHPRELQTDAACQAISRIRGTGAVVYCQAPMIAHVNDDVHTWTQLWRLELAQGAVPYYMFVERDTGPYEYFKVPLARAVDIFHAAYRALPGLARTVRGPVMSATPGKVIVDGVQSGPQGRFFQLRMIQARNPALVGRPFRACFSTSAAWLSDLVLPDDVPDDIRAAISAAGKS
jgi:L-lysine 2,3-aminomutase